MEGRGRLTRTMGCRMEGSDVAISICVCYLLVLLAKPQNGTVCDIPFTYLILIPLNFLHHLCNKLAIMQSF